MRYRDETWSTRLPIGLDPANLTILVHLAGALLAGALIGLERSFHSRPAGFRTHALVCLASSLLMLLTLFQGRWGSMLAAETLRLDPTRMAQGIMTGIGFLGAGVIFKEGLTVRGLTTAASIWVTAAIGIMVGVGFYFPAVVATVATLGVLSGFRWIERHMPAEFYAHHWLVFDRARTMSEPAVRSLIESFGFSIANLSYRLTQQGQCFEYRMVIRTTRRGNVERLAEKLRALSDVLEFRISPTGD
jgi:putative Mg2+ transporter-C (MgtC) family protein